MKRIIRLTVWLWISIFLFSCRDREVQLNTEFPYQLRASTQAGSVVYVNQEVPITLEIQYDHKLRGNTFHVTAALNREQGQLRRDRLPFSSWITKEKGKAILTFEPFESGRNVIYFKALDDHEQSQQDSLVFEVKEPPFNLVFSQRQNTVYKGQEAELLKGPKGIYKYKYQDAAANAILTLDGRDLDREQYYPIELGQHRVTYKPDFSVEGPRRITFDVEDGHGQKVYPTYDVSVEKNAVNVEFTSQPAIYKDQTVELTLKATPKYRIDSLYKLEIESADPFYLTSKNDPYPTPAKKYYEFKGQNLQLKQYTFKPKDEFIGTYNLTATYTDVFGDAYYSSLQIEVVNKVELLSDVDSLYVNDTTSLTIHINAIPREAAANYLFRIYPTNKDAIVVFLLNGILLKTTRTYSIKDLSTSFVIDFSSKEVGKHEINAAVSDTNGSTVIATKEITVLKKPMTLTIKADKDNQNQLQITVEQKRTGGTYKIKYELSDENAGKLKKGNDILTLDDFMPLKPLKPEDLSQNIQFKREKGFTGDVTLQVTVKVEYTDAPTYSDSLKIKLSNGVALKPMW